MKIRNLNILKSVGGHKPGDTLRLLCDDDGQPLEKFWRRRLEDAKIDNCVEWADVEQDKPKGSTKK